MHLREHPDSEAATVLHATALIRLSQPFDAALELEDYLRKFPNKVEAAKLYAALLVDVVNDRPKAEEILLQCSKLAPRDAGVQEGL